MLVILELTVSVGNWNVGLEAGKAIWLEVQISCHLLFKLTWSEIYGNGSEHEGKSVIR